MLFFTTVKHTLGSLSVIYLVPTTAHGSRGIVFSRRVSNFVALFGQQGCGKTVTLSPLHTGDKVEFNTVDFVESRQSRPCRFGPYTLATKSTVSATTLNVSATKSTASATVDFVAGFGNSRLSTESTVLNSTLSPVCTGL